VTTLGVMSNLASNALGVVFPSLFVNNNSTASDIQWLLIVEAIMTTVPFALCILLIRKKPNNAPSHAAANTSASENYKGDLKKLFSNRNYLLLLVVCSTSYGTLVAFTSVIEYLVLPFKYPESSKTASDLLLAAIMSGFVGSVVFVMVLKKTRQYKKLLIVGKCINNKALVGCALEIVCTAFALDTKTFWAIIIIVGFTGFFFIPQVPIIMELGCELAFPIG
jgi:FLVCR family feline leukemia virus subgroup C receptor-related protein